eukprot:6483737-Amphidinium_carterae.1
MKSRVCREKVLEVSSCAPLARTKVLKWTSLPKNPGPEPQTHVQRCGACVCVCVVLCCVVLCVLDAPRTPDTTLAGIAKVGHERKRSSSTGGRHEQCLPRMTAVRALRSQQRHQRCWAELAQHAERVRPKSAPQVGPTPAPFHWQIWIGSTSKADKEQLYHCHFAETIVLNMTLRHGSSHRSSLHYHGLACAIQCELHG